MGPTAAIGHPVIFFDGVCNLCNASVNFVIDRDRGYFRFASLQSKFAIRTLCELGYDPTVLESIVLLENDTIRTKSSAALAIAARLSGGWKILVILKLVPRFIRDWVYELIANHRYKWFGQRDSCRIPTPELRERFLDSDDVM